MNKIWLLLTFLCFTRIESQINNNNKKYNDHLYLEWNRNFLINRTLNFSLIDNRVVIDLLKFDFKNQTDVESLFTRKKHLKVSDFLFLFFANLTLKEFSFFRKLISANSIYHTF
jgi:hypothetical protein